ncbi:acyltransferase [Dactylosporangium sp. AC04546]|uniref:acyltransferase family protein n=1 Tax=Dactylosporangium sp. AC04546 TaxID=2862460 RepID=UPI001EE0F78C|nr:acyltransferase [Dactylosporangium sp. AC04546]WVK87416.1 acyltransferase [Dactylosporangium sp. AC04546]
MNRDTSVDALRAVAVAGVVLGHWLVSAVVSDPYDTSALHGESPLQHAPYLAPASWLFQTLGLFFFASGFAATRRKTSSGKPRKQRRLLVPVLILAAVWLPALGILKAAGAPDTTTHVVESLVTHPLWFLAAYLVLTAAAPALKRLVRTAGAPAVLLPLLFVVLTDAFREDGLPEWWRLTMVPVAWSVPYLLGIALAQERLSPRHGPLLAVSGLAGGALLLTVAGYPPSAVGVPGDRFSNLDPPSLAAMSLVMLQIGMYLMLRDRLRHTPATAAVTGTLNRHALSIFLWHQPALLLVTFAALAAGRPAGLLDAPDGAWVLHRLPWLPVFAIALTALTWVFHRYERRTR